jgi:hypothetical protein
MFGCGVSLVIFWLKLASSQSFGTTFGTPTPLDKAHTASSVNRGPGMAAPTVNGSCRLRETKMRPDCSERTDQMLDVRVGVER